MRLCRHEFFFYTFSGTVDQHTKDIFKNAFRTVRAVVFINYLVLFGLMRII